VSARADALNARNDVSDLLLARRRFHHDHHQLGPFKVAESLLPGLHNA
jgi:hypothetical protein